MDERGADEALVRFEVLDLGLNEGEQLFFDRSLVQLAILPYGGDRMVDLELEEVERDVVLRLEVVEDRAFGDLRLAGDLLCGRRVESLRLEEHERRIQDASAD